MYFKPQVVYVSVMFLTVLAETLGTGLAHMIPRWGRIGRLLNPGPWNRKEHTAAVLMASAASVSALSTEALTVQKLWYGGYPSVAAGIFVTLSSQLIGYGVAGMMRSVLLYPTKMLYPANLPITTVMETLHKPKSETRKRFQVFWIVFVAIFCWEWFPEVSPPTQAHQVMLTIVVHLPSPLCCLRLLPRRPPQPRLHKPLRRLPR